MRYFQQGTRTVDDACLVQVEGLYYAAAPGVLYSEVLVRIYDGEIEILQQDGALLRRHPKSHRKGHFEIPEEDRIFNPSRETARILSRVQKIGPHSYAFGRQLFARLGRPGQKALYGLSNLPRHYSCAQIEIACERVLQSGGLSYQSVRRILEHQADPATPANTRRTDPAIRPIDDYQQFWEAHARDHDHDHHHEE